ncbi:MAG: PIN domain-containing protein [Armatimonadota bacterium]|nr:PIN domain-containing protein [Armatimonadota bacterium]MDR7487175.1 PIN domain-containing protein [Armatimonadota bacterium]MDR7533381.1 PIN domain-containing protein [Armatimonadota bacterium]MDR7536501.1 PIN domain-containing protein [Armatimonadota bacterium]
MGILIDASVFLAAERGRLSLARRLAGQEDEPVALSALTACELLCGVDRAADPQRRARRARFVRAILERFPVVAFDLDAARVYARLCSELAARGETVATHVLLIGSTAIASDFQVATADPRDYQRIPGLQVQVWTG